MAIQFALATVTAGIGEEHGVHGNPGWSSSIRWVVELEEGLGTLEQATETLELT
jgi:hypothetical protein